MARSVIWMESSGLSALIWMLAELSGLMTVAFKPVEALTTAASPSSVEKRLVLAAILDNPSSSTQSIPDFTGGPEAPARIGVSVVDVATGMNAYEAVLEALIARGRTGEGAAISVSLFDAMADWMTVPLLQHEGGKTPQRIGLAHPSISPYGVFKSRDGADILISIQNDREWRVLAEKVMGDTALAADPDFATNVARVKRRPDTDGRVQAAFGAMDVADLEEKLAGADIAYARVNDTGLLAKHPHLRRVTVGSPSGPISMPAPAPTRVGETRDYGPIPALGEHTEAIKKEFGKH